MFLVAKGQSVAAEIAGSPAVFYHLDGGFLRDLHALSFSILRATTDDEQLAPVQVLAPVSLDVGDGDPDRLSAGRYVARFDVPSDASWSTTGLGRFLLRWRWTSVAGGPERTADEVFEVVAGVPAGLGRLLALPSDARWEGAPSSVSVLRLMRGLSDASAKFERWTRRAFGPLYVADKLLNGSGAKVLLLDEPIIGIDSIAFESTSVFISETALDNQAYRVGNRHLHGVLQPDDRDNPRVELYGFEDVYATFNVMGGRFPRGRQNIRLSGVFGYTDPGPLPWGEVPEPVRRAVVVLAAKSWTGALSDDAASASVAPFVTAESTREQSVTFGGKTGGPNGGGVRSAVGLFSGDPAVDQVVLAYRAPPRMGAV